MTQALSYTCGGLLLLCGALYFWASWEADKADRLARELATAERRLVDVQRAQEAAEQAQAAATEADENIKTVIREVRRAPNANDDVPSIIADVARAGIAEYNRVRD